MSDAAALMDHMYRRQRHIYDASRKFYLLGRDEAINRLRPARGGKALEIGCGTGRNLVKLAQSLPAGSVVRTRRVAGNARDCRRFDRARGALLRASRWPRRTRLRSIRKSCLDARISSA